MPFIIPIIAVATGVVTGVAAAITIAGAFVSAFGYFTGNENASKIGGILSLAGGVAGLAGGADPSIAGSGGAGGADAIVEAGAADAAGGSLSAEAAAEVGGGAAVTGTVDTGTAGLAQNEPGLVNPERLLGPPDTALASGADTSLAGAGTDSGLAGDPTKTDPAGDIIKKAVEDTQKQTTVPEINKPATTSTAGAGAPNGAGGPPVQDSSILGDLAKQWDKLGDSSKAAIIKIGGEALSSAFGDDPNRDYVKLAREKHALELEKYRTRMKNINNIGQITLGMNPTPVDPATGLPYPRTQ